MTSANEPIAGLPHAEGRTFTNLDDYLSHLHELSKIGVPYYAEVAPGIFERRSQVRPRQGKFPRSTREELERRFGFARQ
ncbi:MAG: hypothetical protein AB7O57_22045 [Hyphomicrobiaceae bacterium]